MEVLRASWRLRSSSERRGCAVAFPHPMSIRTRLLYFFLQTFSHPPSYPSSPGTRQAFPRPGNSRLFLTLVSTLVSDTDRSQVHQVPAILRNGLLLPPESTQTQYELNSTVLGPRGFRPGLIIPHELEVYKPASKVVPSLHAFTCPRPSKAHSRPVSLFRLPPTTLVPLKSSPPSFHHRLSLLTDFASELAQHDTTELVSAPSATTADVGYVSRGTTKG
jgi:hypothetical protein